MCYDVSSEKTRKRELDALVEATEELHCDNLLVITNSQEEKIEWMDNLISIIPASKYQTINIMKKMRRHRHIANKLIIYCYR